MIKYYWYITLKPDTTSPMGHLNLDSYVRRFTSSQPNDLFYITETIDGYKHTIKEKNNVMPVVTINDYGKIYNIEEINKQIVTRLKDQWLRMNGVYNESERKNHNIDNQSSSSMWDFINSSNSYENPMESMPIMRKRSVQRVRPKLRKKVCKCVKRGKNK